MSNITPSNVIQITPFMHVNDLDRTLAFFTDILGFETTFRMTGYAYVQLGTAGIRILENKRQRQAAARRPALRVLHRRA